MKILVISLLRLGDALLASPAIAALKAANPFAEIDLLVNRGNERVSAFLPQINRIHVVDREMLQEGLVRGDRPIFESYDRLKVLVDRLNSQKYDKIINLTQTRFSGYLAGAIQCNEKMGMVLNHRGQVSFGSPWFRYLNDVMGAGARQVFHYSDLFKFACIGDTETLCNPLSVAETKSGRAEAEAWIREHALSGGPKILLQVLTSDEKKNWSFEKWIEALREARLHLPDAQFIAFGSQFENDKILQFQKMAAESQVTVEPAILGLEGAYSLMHLADVLVTSDTSIKHLAALSPVRIIELAIGSSDSRRTGVYKSGALIISTNENCAPCRHSDPCRREKHYCAINLDARAIGISIVKYIQKDWQALSIIADEYSDMLSMWQTQADLGGFWLQKKLGPRSLEDHLSCYLDRLAWRVLLNRENEQKLGSYGTEGVKFKDWYEQLHDHLAAKEKLQLQIQEMENDTRAREERISRVVKELHLRLRRSSHRLQEDFIDEEIGDEIKALEKDLELGSFLTEKVQIDPKFGLYRVRSLEASLNEAYVHQQIKLKLLRTFRQVIGDNQ